MKKRKAAIVFGLIICLLGIGNADVLGYALKGWKVTTPKTFIMHRNFDSLTVTNFNHALAKWNAQAGKLLMSRSPNSKHSSTNYPSEDGNNYVYRINAGQEYLAETTTYYVDGRVTEADINVNISYPYANSGHPGLYDIYTVLLHESGHVAGLDHSEYSNAVMYKSVEAGTEKRNLHFDDRDGINAIYK